MPISVIGPGAVGVDDSTLPCVRCGGVFPDSDFYAAPRNTRRRGRNSWCKGCYRANQQRLRADRSPERVEAHRALSRKAARSKRLRKYGLTEESYGRMLADQGEVCAICGKPESVVQPHRKTPGRDSLAIDHCHRTGKVRGLLCFMCNTAIGKFGDDPELLRKAIAYLEAHAE